MTEQADRKQWKQDDIVGVADTQRWEDKPTTTEVKEMVNTDAGKLISDHVTDKNNPHGVTASQTGAYTTAQTDAKDTEMWNHIRFLGTQAEVDALTETERKKYLFIGVLKDA